MSLLDRIRGGVGANEAAPDQAQATQAHVDAVGLPSLGKRRRRNGAVTAAGFAVIGALGLAAVVAVNQTPEATAPRALPGGGTGAGQGLPPLALGALDSVAPPPPVPNGTLASLTRSAGSAAAASQPPVVTGAYQVPGIEATAPIPLRPSAPKSVAAVGGGVTPDVRSGEALKAPQDWLERKFNPELMVGGKGGATGQSGSQGVMSAEAAATRIAALQAGSSTALTRGDESAGLSAKLQPSVLRPTSAVLMPDRDFVIAKGALIDCALETAIDTTVPGLTTCRVTRDVYSDNGRVVLLERGTQLVGEQQGGIRLGQARVFVLWTRAKTPKGVVIDINSPGTDALGRAGLDGWVDQHFAERFGAAILMTFIQDSLKAMLARAQTGGGTTAYYGNTAESGAAVVSKILESTVSIPPTLIKNQGDHIQIIAARDLSFAGVYSLRALP